MNLFHNVIYCHAIVFSEKPMTKIVMSLLLCAWASIQTLLTTVCVSFLSGLSVNFLDFCYIVEFWPPLFCLQSPFVQIFWILPPFSLLHFFSPSPHELVISPLERFFLKLNSLSTMDHRWQGWAPWDHHGHWWAPGKVMTIGELHWSLSGGKFRPKFQVLSFSHFREEMLPWKLGNLLTKTSLINPDFLILHDLINIDLL